MSRRREKSCGCQGKRPLKWQASQRSILINIENNHIIPALPVIIQLIQIFNLPAAKYFNQLAAGEEHDQRQRISRKVMMCPEEHLPVIEGALDGAIENE